MTPCSPATARSTDALGPLAACTCWRPFIRYILAIIVVTSLVAGIPASIVFIVVTLLP
jgi:hypothetical protein